MVVSHIFVIQGLCYDPDKLASDVVRKKVAEVHDRSVVLTAKPWFLLSLSFTPDVAMITSWNLFASTEVLPQTIFEEGL